MRKASWPRFALSLSLTIGLLWAAELLAQDDSTPDRLQHVDTLTRGDLQSVCCVNFSPDGRHLYAAAWQANCVSVYQCNADDGRLEHLQSVVSAANLHGVTSIQISADGQHAVAAAFRSRSLVLFKRDPESGKLTVLDVARGDQRPELGLRWPIDAVLSDDGRFVYLLDPQQARSDANAAAQGGISVFRLTAGGKLELVEVHTDRPGTFRGGRGIVFHPDGKLGFVACAESARLVVIERDQQTGKLAVRQVVQDKVGAARALAGAMRAACSPDGRFVYVSSGRFSGDSAVSAFRLSNENELQPVQEIVNDRGELRNFLGGNEITVSPDGEYVYAAATRSGALASFRRDEDSGRLTLLETLVAGNVTGQLAGAAGCAVSPTGKFVYVAAEFAQSIEILERK